MSDSLVEVRPQQHCAIVWLNGPGALESLVQRAGIIAAHPDWSADFDMIVVVGADSDLNDITLEKLVEHQTFFAEWSAIHRNGPNSRSAIVCRDDLKQVLVELWLAVRRQAGGVEDLVFDRLEDALARLARA